MFAVNHFVKKKLPLRIVHNVITKYDECDYIRDKLRPTRPKKLSQVWLTRLKCLFNHKTSIYVR